MYSKTVNFHELIVYIATMIPFLVTGDEPSK
jgi:hypothetical protein